VTAFLQLTRGSGYPVLIRVDAIDAIEETSPAVSGPFASGCTIATSADEIEVLEPLADVRNLLTAAGVTLLDIPL
jgi:hypothetical protein